MQDSKPSSSIPFNESAESAVLGALLIDPDAVHTVAAFLKPPDFYRERNAWIYQAILDVIERGGQPDFVTVSDLLDERKQLKAAGGAAYLTQLIGDTPTSVYVDYYAKLIVRDAVKRRVIGAASQIAAIAQNGIEPTDLLAQARDLLDAAGPAVNSTEDTLLWRDSFLTWEANQLARQEARKCNTPRLTLPWRSMSKHVLPLDSKAFAVVAAGSSVGKTMFMESCADHWAKLGFQVVFLHFELSEQTMLDRRICRWTGVSMADLYDGLLDERTSRAHAIAERWQGAIHYIYSGGWTVQQVCARVRTMRTLNQCDVVILDYLQLLNVTAARGQNETSAFDKDLQRLKDFCGGLGVPVLAGSQLSGEGQAQARKSAVFARNSRAIFDKANLAITLDRPKLEAPIIFNGERLEAGERSPETLVIVDKQSGGNTGDFKLIAVPGRFLFTDIAEEGGHND